MVVPNRIRPRKGALVGLALCTSSLALLSSPSAHAQANANVSQKDEGEIVVTARKREESVQDVPLALTVVTGDSLEQRGINDFQALSQSVSGFVYTSDYNGRALFTVRGSGGSLDPALSVGVGVFVDGVFQSNPGYLATPLFDVERVEILKGPQSTLYGQNTLAGAVSITTRAPNSNFEGRVRAEYGTGNSKQIAGLISGPISGDTLFGRVTMGLNDRDGFFNYRTGGDADNSRSFYTRGVLLWRPSADFQADLRLQYFNQRSRGFYNREVTDFNDINGFNGDFRVVDSDPNANVGKAKYFDASVKLQYNIDNFRFTSLTSYSDNYNYTTLDQDLQSLDIFNAIRKGDRRQTSQELRVEYSSEVTDLIGGIYYSNERFDDSSQITLGQDFVVPFLRGLVIVSPLVRRKTETFAVFADAVVRPTDRLELGVGIRYDDSTISATVINAERGFKPVLPRFTIRYKASEAVNIYANASRGFRIGGFNSGAAIGTPFQTFDPDKLWQYEGGFKARSPNGSFTLDGSAFYVDYRNYNFTNFVPVASGNAVVTTGLARNAISYGFEADASFAVSDQFRLTASGGYNKTKLKNIIVLAPGAPVLSVEGDGIPFTPLWNLAVSGNYVAPLKNDWEVSLFGQITGIGPSAAGFSPPSERNPYFELNLSASVGNDRLTFTVFGNNILNKKWYSIYVDRSLFTSGNPGAHSVALPGPPARGGVRLDFKF